MTENIPQTLYRGMKFTQEDFRRYDLAGGIPLPNYYKENDSGERVVSDGQEFGIYMGNQQLAEIYGTVFRGVADGTIVDKDIQLCMERHSLALPKIGVLYEIQTEGLDVKSPHLTTFAGHQAAISAEYISKESIPASHVRVKELVMGSDLLFDQKSFEPSDLTSAKMQIEHEFAKRRFSFELLAFDLSGENKNDLLRMDRKTEGFLRTMYGENGAVTTQCALNLSNDKDFMKFCVDVAYKEKGFNLKTVKDFAHFEDRLAGLSVNEKVTSLVNFVASSPERTERLSSLADTLHSLSRIKEIVEKDPEDRTWAEIDFLSSLDRVDFVNLLEQINKRDEIDEQSTENIEDDFEDR